MKPRQHLYSFKDMLLVYSLIAFSTIPFFKGGIGRGLLILSILSLYSYLIKSFKREALIILLIVFVLEVYHVSYFPKYDLTVFRDVVSFFLIGIFTAYHLKLNFLGIYIKIMYVTTLISFIFFIGLLLNPAFIHFIDDSTPSIFRITSKYSEYMGDYLVRVNPIIYNFDYNFYEIRNNGPFWEPTVFASLLLIGQLFNFLIHKRLFNRTGIIFTIGIITTFSTTVFVGYLIFAACTILINPRITIITKGASFILTVIISIYLFYELPFLQEKINAQITGVESNIEARGDSRIAGATLDLIELSQSSQYVLFGKGSDRDSRIAGLDKMVQRNCGLTGLLVEWGIFFFLLYISLLYYSFYQLSRIHGLSTLFAIPCTLCILIVSFSEVFFDLPLFHTFIFFGFVVKRYYRPIYHQPVPILEVIDISSPHTHLTSAELAPSLLPSASVC